MTYDFSPLKSGIQKAKEWLQNEYFGIRTGRATPMLLDNIKVDAYGAPTPINQLATVTVEDAKTLRVSVWDTGLVKEVEKAVVSSDLGVSMAVDDQGGRIIFPELTSERRTQFAKLVKDKLEEGRVRIRTEREKAWHELQKQEKDGDISKDDLFRLKEDMQKLVDDAVKDFEAIAKKKEEEIMS